MYYFGLGVPQDYKEAMRWYTLAAQQGLFLSQYALGRMYYNGQGVAQDYKEAMRWWKLAAQQGDVSAQHNLGLLYGLGRGVLQDNTRAHMWFNIAAARGDKDGVKLRDAAARVMTPQEVAEAQRMARECMDSNFKKCD
jgi:TPR repeat protein